MNPILRILLFVFALITICGCGGVDVAPGGKPGVLHDGDKPIGEVKVEAKVNPVSRIHMITIPLAPEAFRP